MATHVEKEKMQLDSPLVVPRAGSHSSDSDSVGSPSFPIPGSQPSSSKMDLTSVLSKENNLQTRFR
eukprot:EC718213.1.p1 GENE.EC718213.1~~EC718213.1.p1  ORF type:complete len:66 (+),score=0.05 EC718213.1:74-271(+)